MDRELWREIRCAKKQDCYYANTYISRLEKNVLCSCWRIVCRAQHGTNAAGEGSIDHPISFASRKLSTTEKSYTTTEREGLAMVFAL